MTTAVICGTNLSYVWAKLFLQAKDTPGIEISPVTISLTGFDSQGAAVEDVPFRDHLDRILKHKCKQSIEISAFTIFPERFWQHSGKDRSKLFKRYLRAFPRLQALNRRANGRGMYFERLVRYGRGPCNGNQLEWILSQYLCRKGLRRSMFQATTFDPERDHVPNRRLGFPCLQQVSFVPLPTNELVINAFYATQQMFGRAYGNYLGLSRLGAFMAHEMKLRLVRLNVMVGVAKFDELRKRDPDLQPLIAAARALVASHESRLCSSGTTSAETT